MLGFMPSGKPFRANSNWCCWGFHARLLRGILTEPHEAADLITELSHGAEIRLVASNFHKTYRTTILSCSDIFGNPLSSGIRMGLRRTAEDLLPSNRAQGRPIEKRPPVRIATPARRKPIDIIVTKTMCQASTCRLSRLILAITRNFALSAKPRVAVKSDNFVAT